MISVLLYGRNDAHGYNLHRRAALSLNCIAEVLSDPADEIIFVDYNTPDELPTFIEAISDTLTERCLDVLRVLRVPAAIHNERFARRTHLTAIEPVSRNVAIRRANPSNRWLLSTNTDMLFLPLAEASVSDICRDLADGFYGLPRFELPEWVWERLPRADPAHALAEIERLGPSLGLDEPTVSHEWIRFDAPGDFQLILRADLIAIDGFNEEMLLGYHVDSNLSRRMLLHRGSIESLAKQLASYHCNHIRVPTVYHGANLITNDLDQFFYSVNRATLPAQHSTWGLPDVDLEEVPIRTRAALDIGDRVAMVVSNDPHPRTASDATGFSLTYDSRHVLPFIADSLVISPLSVKVGYVGANPVLRRLLQMLAGELQISAPLAVAELDNLASVDELSQVADVIVVDLGMDVSLGDITSPRQDDVSARGLLHDPRQALTTLERLFELERQRLERGDYPRRMVLVNSATAFWDSYVLANLDCSHTSVHSRVRRATVKLVPDADAAPALEFAHRQLRWVTRRRPGDGRLHLVPNVRMKVAELDDFPGFGDGWSYPDDTGIWTEGRVAVLDVTLEGEERHGALVLGVDGACVGATDSVAVDVFVDGEPAAHREFRQTWWHRAASVVRSRGSRLDCAEGSAAIPRPSATSASARPHRRLSSVQTARRLADLTATVWRIPLPVRVVGDRTAKLTFVINEPHRPIDLGWSNDRRALGLHIRSLKLEASAASARR